MRNLLAFMTVFALGVVLVSFTASRLSTVSTAKEMPENVKAAVDKLCFGCHNTASSNAKAKEKLDFTTLSGLSKAVQIGKFREIGETVKNGEMPPKKFLDNYPDKKPTAEESKLLIKWTEDEVKNLMKN